MLSIETFSALLDGIDVLVCGLTPVGFIWHFNRRCEQATGLTRDDAVGKDWREIFATRERHEDVAALWQQVTCGQTHRPYEAICRNNRRIRWHFSKWQPAPEGIEQGLCASGIDVTQEREALARAREVERTIALAHLAAGLAHEIRNPLNNASLQLKVAERHLTGSNDGVKDAIRAAGAEIRRTAELLDDFLIFARPEALKLDRVDLRALAARAIGRKAKLAMKAGVEIDLLPGPSPLIEGDEHRIGQAVDNLLTNAIEAASPSPGGRVQLCIEMANNAACLLVEDNGPGLPAPDAPIFDAFFSTKPRGTGMGLAIVQRVALDHGGSITAARRRDWTVFRLALPIVFGALPLASSESLPKL
jgi:PAS domain S-box-containing protein